METPLYDAFISYSHKADGRLAPRMQTALGRIARPWYRRRALRAFRDETTLTATPELWPTIKQALEQSRFFILLASPDAAASPWVNQEIAYWLTLQRPGEAPPAHRLLIALTDGKALWLKRGADGTGDFDWQTSTALPPALKEAFAVEPLYVDFTWARDDPQLTLKYKPWYDNIARLAAAIRGLPLDELIGEDIRQHRIAIGSAAAAALMATALGAGLISTWKKADVLITEKQHQTDAERVLPQLEGLLGRVRNQPIRELSIEFDPSSFFDDKPQILELRLELNPLFTQPMSVYFARFIEGRTWPPEFGFKESHYTDFPHGTARVDAKFRWFDRQEPLSQSIDGTETGITPTFSLKFSGEDFNPGGPGIHLRQAFEVPSLQKLIDDGVSFRLIRHDPVARQATEIEAGKTIEMRVVASFQDAGDVRRLVLFDANPSRLAQDVLGGDYLVNRRPIERMVLLSLYPPIRNEPRALREQKEQEVKELLRTREPKTDDDRRNLARAINVSARLGAFRGQDLEALNGFVDIVQLLEPLVLDPARHIRYEDARVMYEAAVQPVYYFIGAKKFSRARDFYANPVLIVRRVTQADPNEPDYIRWRASNDLMLAHIIHGEGVQGGLADALRSYVDTQRKVYRQVPSDATRFDLMDALERGANLARGWGLPATLAQDWLREAESLKEAVPAGRAEDPGQG